MRKRILMLVVAVLMLAPLVVGAQTTTITFTYTWGAPTTGNAVAVYEVQTSTNNGATWSAVGTSTTTSKTIDMTVGLTYIVRVRGIDALGQTGAWSPVSDPNTPNGGAPGACGKPAKTP